MEMGRDWGHNPILECSSDISEIRERVLAGLSGEEAVTDEDLKGKIAKEANDYLKGSTVSIKQRKELEKYIFDSLRKMDVLQELIDDPDVTEIMVNGYTRIFYEKNGQIHRYEKQFLSEEKLMDILQLIVSGHNRVINQTSPIVDSRLPDGSRVHIVLSPISIDGATLTIRRFPKHAITMDELLKYNSISLEAAVFLEQLVRKRYNVFISGGTSSGKTTFLNALSQFIPKDERIITIEDSAELQIQGIANLVRLETRNSNLEGMSAITIRDLIKASLRMRPDRIIVGECRGAEALDMLQSMNSGHDGSLSTGHSNSCEDMLHRLETMVMMGMDLPLLAIRQQIASGIDVMVHLARLKDKSRKVVKIAEVCGVKDGEIELNPLFALKDGSLIKVGQLQNVEKWQMNK